MTISMPRSPIVDGTRNARPEWRQYLGAVEIAIKQLETLQLDGGPAQAIAALKARLEPLKSRIGALPDAAQNRHERIVMWRDTVVNNQGGCTFSHGLGTRHVWWQIRDLANGGNMICAQETAEVQGLDEASIRLGTGPGVFDATIWGVISDRY